MCESDIVMCGRKWSDSLQGLNYPSQGDNEVMKPGEWQTRVRASSGAPEGEDARLWLGAYAEEHALRAQGAPRRHRRTRQPG